MTLVSGIHNRGIKVVIQKFLFLFVYLFFYFACYVFICAGDSHIALHNGITLLASTLILTWYLVLISNQFTQFR